MDVRIDDENHTVSIYAETPEAAKQARTVSSFLININKKIEITLSSSSTLKNTTSCHVILQAVLLAKKANPFRSVHNLILEDFYHDS